METVFAANTPAELAAELAAHFARVAASARRHAQMASKVKDKDRWEVTAVAFDEAAAFCRNLRPQLPQSSP